ncbi:MAG: HAMP domain-containing sensor histidine kinase [Gemmatimonadaceae bacterium]|nr:HAMP domain-containing sensor histidine kinase [Gemmatimonadaceae bacterium]
MRRRGPVFLVALGLLLMLGSFVWYAQRVVDELRSESERTGRMIARIYGALTDTTTGSETAALLELSQEVRELGVPVIVTDVEGRPNWFVNIPEMGSGMISRGDPRYALLVEMVRTLDRQNRPVIEPGIGQIHFGNTPLVRGLKVIPLLQVAMLSLLIVAGIMALGVRARAERERVWAGMAREAAHQLGTPLSSLKGWLELLSEREGDAAEESARHHMQGDVERLERVAHRFERIGRPPKLVPADVADVVEAVVDYFRARVPTLANTVVISFERGDGPLVAPVDRVLMEWAVESLIKNAVDALAGRGGTIAVRVDRFAGGGARVRVSDDGPGIPQALKRKIFAAGFTTKERGWGIGLPLARRIIEESHNGRLVLVASESGAVFDVIVPG